MNDFNMIHALYHSEMAKRELERKKRLLDVLNTDFLVDLPDPVRNAVDQFRWGYSDRKWFPEAWEEYRKHVLEAGLGGKIKMPGVVFNKYLDKYESKELEKIYATEAIHSEETCEDYLAHHGIKGQKWGVRRFQNEDGSLTKEGEDKYLLSKGKQKKLARKTERELNALVKEKNLNNLRAYLNYGHASTLKKRYEQLEEMGKTKKAEQVKKDYEKKQSLADSYFKLSSEKRKEIEDKVQKMSKDANLTYRTYLKETKLGPFSDYSWASTGYKVRSKDSKEGRSKEYNDAERKINRGEKFVQRVYYRIY